MEVQWFSKNYKGVISIYETNITLNTAACAHFKNAYKIIIGYSPQDSTLVIRNLNKEEADSGTYAEYEMHEVSIKPSYGRINGKNIVKHISEFYHLDFTSQSLYKFECIWNEETKSLSVPMKGVVK